MMPSKSARGVQQDEIWAAADALLLEGLRPTIERVRQKIGRGSPNTVSPMLEAWFASLGPRLSVSGSQAQADDLPPPVWQAMTKLWDIALVSAREESVQALTQSRQLLADELAALELAKTQLTREVQAFNDRQAAVNEAADMSRAHIADLSGRLKESLMIVTHREVEIDALRLRLEAAAAQSETERHRTHDEAKRRAEERNRLEERAVANERRLLGELDRARQDAKQARLILAETERRSQAALKELEQANLTLGEQLSQIQVDRQSMQQGLDTANERSRELNDLLEQERMATRGAFEQLNRRLEEAAIQTIKKSGVHNPTMALRSKRMSARKG